MYVFEKNGEQVKISPEHIAKEFVEKNSKNLQSGMNLRKCLGIFLTANYGKTPQGDTYGNLTEGQIEELEECVNKELNRNDPKKLTDRFHILRNFTGHIVKVHRKGKGSVSFLPEGQAHVRSWTRNIGSIGKAPITETVYGEVQGLPDPTEGEGFIVSMVVAKNLPHREDLFVPNQLIRDEGNRVNGCKSLALNPFLNSSDHGE